MTLVVVALEGPGEEARTKAVVCSSLYDEARPGQARQAVPAEAAPVPGFNVAVPAFPYRGAQPTAELVVTVQLPSVGLHIRQWPTQRVRDELQQFVFVGDVIREIGCFTVEQEEPSRRKRAFQDVGTASPAPQVPCPN